MRDPIGLTAEVGKACKFELAFAVKKKKEKKGLITPYIHL